MATHDSSSLPTITHKTSPVQRHPSTRDSIKSSRSSFGNNSDRFDRLVATATSMTNRSISPAPRGLELPDVSLRLRSSTKNSTKSFRGSRSSFVYDHPERDTEGKNGSRSYSNLSDSLHGSIDGDNNGKHLRGSRSSFNLSDSNHGANTSMKSSARSSFDRDNDGNRSSRVARNSFNSDTDSVKSSHTITSENNANPNLSQRRATQSARLARLMLDESEDDDILPSTTGNYDEWTIRQYIDAVLNGSLENVKRIVEYHKIDPNALQTDDFHALFAASGEGHLSVVHYLLSKGSNVNFIAPVSLYSPLHAAATDGHVEVMEALIDAGAHLNSVNINGWTPLWKATRSGQFEAVQLLLDRGADIEMVDLVGMTVLHVACKLGYFEVVKMLLERGAKVNVLTQAGETPFYLCATSSDWVAEQGNLTCLLILKEFGADMDRPDATGKTAETEAGELLQPFFRLCHLKPESSECLDLLKEDEYYLWFALIMANCKSVFVKELIKLHPCLETCKDARGRIAYDMASPLMKEVFNHSPFQAPFFSHTPKTSRANSNILSQPQKDMSSNNMADLLHMMGDITDSLDEFVTQWAEMTPTEKDMKLRTLARDGELTDRHIALMRGTNLNCVDAYGWTPLFEAIHHGHLQVVKLLFLKGADVDIRDKAGWTPLYLAAYYGHLDVLKFLAVKGCYIEQADNKGKKPIDVAQSEDICHFLLNAPEEIRKIKREERISEHQARKSSNSMVLRPDIESKLSIHHYRTSSKGLSRSSKKDSGTSNSKLPETLMNGDSSGGIVDPLGKISDPDEKRESTETSTTGSLPRLSISFPQESVNVDKSPQLFSISPRGTIPQPLTTASLSMDNS